MNMTETDFLKQYGSIPLNFVEMYKYRVTYKNEELGITCSGHIEYRDDMKAIETPLSLAQLEYFGFAIK